MALNISNCYHMMTLRFKGLTLFVCIRWQTRAYYRHFTVYILL